MSEDETNGVKEDEDNGASEEGAPPGAIRGWEDPRRVLGRHGLVPKRAFSQNFLVSRSAVERIAQAVELQAGDWVVELGAGLGTLTWRLLATGAHVVAVDRDRDMLAVLRQELREVPAVEVIEADAATFELGSVSARAKTRIAVAGNLPYAITGAILRHLVQSKSEITRAVVMVQREVRDRLLADPGTSAYGALTVFSQAAFEISHVLHVPPGGFHPPPKVASAVVKLVPRDQARAEETEGFRQVVRAAFDARRKTLRNALVQSIGDAGRVDRALARAAIDGKRRGETLAVEEFAALSSALEDPPRDT